MSYGIKSGLKLNSVTGLIYKVGIEVMMANTKWFGLLCKISSLAMLWLVSLKSFIGTKMIGNDVLISSFGNKTWDQNGKTLSVIA